MRDLKCTIDYICPLDWCHATRDVASASELPAADVLPRRSVTMSIPFSFEQLARIRNDIVVLPKPSTPDVALAAVQNVARVEGVRGS